MTRTLRALSRPAPIAVWSQNVPEGWDSYAGRQRRSPTADEIRIQAYEALANGITGLYWYSLQSWSTLKYCDTITETTRIGEVRMLEAIYSRADALGHERRSTGKQPDWDLNSIVAPHTAVLFAIDLSYYTVLIPGSAVPGWPAEVLLPVDLVWKSEYSASVPA